MITLLSPAKLLDAEARFPDLPSSPILFAEKSQTLVNKLKKFSAPKLAKLMDISAELGVLNKKRYEEWQLPFTHENAVQAILLFQGDVYRGLRAHEFTRDELQFSQEHVRILSGLYGLLRPLDLIQPYRLMMGTPFTPSPKYKNLYSFWGDDTAQVLRSELRDDETIINLASSEYFRVIEPHVKDRNVITCEFREAKNGTYAPVMTFAKQARGLMARYIVKNRIDRPEDLKGFDSNDYRFHNGLSHGNTLIFTREKSYPVSQGLA